MKGFSKNKGSFRDPGGFIYSRDGNVYRQINISSKDDFDYLMDSGLYQDLVEKNMIVEHEEVDLAPFDKSTSYKVIQPTKIPFISYPYEWCFSQYQRAALATLEIQNKALDYGMTLKDASAYNIQFVNNDPVLIDTLSFEIYREGKPWVAYRQFCQHFLAPLALMCYRDIRLSQLLRIYIDGIPLDLASELLPFKTRMKFPLLTHIHLHAAAQNHYAGEKIDMADSRRGISKTGIQGILSSLESIVKSLEWKPKGTAWADYELTHNYAEISFEHKKQLVSAFLDKVQPATVWDLGANTGEFSRLASQRGIQTMAFDIDPGAVELNYRRCVTDRDQYLYPLLLDLTNPSPDLGWFTQERLSLLKRSSADLVMALALVHHLAITNNVPLQQIAQFMTELSPWLIIEFVPKQDSQTQKLLASREDIFTDYSQNKFEEMFSTFYQIEDYTAIKGTDRMLYLMKRK